MHSWFFIHSSSVQTLPWSCCGGTWNLSQENKADIPWTRRHGPRHSHAFTSWGNFELPIHLTRFLGARGNSFRCREDMQTSAQTVTWAQDRIWDPGPVKQQCSIPWPQTSIPWTLKNTDQTLALLLMLICLSTYPQWGVRCRVAAWRVSWSPHCVAYTWGLRPEGRKVDTEIRDKKMSQ